MKVNKIINKLLGKINVLRIDSYNRFFWNLKAKYIHKQWGHFYFDYNILKSIISDIRPERILDIGCGSGRLFPLYKDIGIKEIIALDISQNAIALARKRKNELNAENIVLVKAGICDLEYPDNYFDLIISNRTLSAIFPENIKRDVGALAKLSGKIYLNEMTDSDFSPSPYWFRHDYGKIMAINNMTLIITGIIPGSEQTYYLFGKNI